MAISITVDGVDVTSGAGYRTEFESVRVTEDILNDQWEFHFSITIENQAVPRPKTNTEVIFQNGTTREFGGIMAVVKEYLLSPGIYQYKCIANNYQQWLDRHLVAEDYLQQPADELIKAMINTYCPGFTTNHVQAAPDVPQQRISYKTVSDTMRSLANLLSWQWYVDYEKDVHFFVAEGIAAPIGTLYMESDLENYGDWVFEEDGTQVRNQVVAVGFYITSTDQVSIYITCDGQNNTYHLPQMPAGTDSKDITLTGGGAPAGGWKITADVTAGMPGGPTKGDYTAYVNVQNQTVRFDPTPPSGAVVSGSMYYKFQPVYIQNDPALIQQMKAREGGTSDGIYEYAIRDPRLSSDSTILAQVRTAYALAKYGSPNITAKFTSFTQGWRAGQSFNVTSNDRLDGQIQNQYFYVARCTKTLVTNPDGTPTLKYELTVSDRVFIWGGT